MKLKFLILALFGVALLGCEKEDGDNGNSEKTNLLTGQIWRFDNAGFALGSSTTIVLDISSQLPTCLTDNTISFDANGSGIVNEGATKCEPTDPATSSFTWSFANNETAMNINGEVIAGSQGGQFKIVTLSETQLKLSKDTTFQGVQGSLIATLKH